MPTLDSRPRRGHPFRQRGRVLRPSCPRLWSRRGERSDRH